MYILAQKTCTKCNQVKDIEKFPRRKDSKDGFRSYCKVCDNTRYKKWRSQNVEKSRESYKRHYYRNLEKERAGGREKRRSLRLEVLTAYGNACACCGETTYEFLAIDHINGDGSRERKISPNTYSLIKRNGFPPGYRVLCHNCNQSLGSYGFCPHNNLEPLVKR